MAAKISALGLILSSYPYLRSAMVRFPFVVSLSQGIHNLLLILLQAQKHTVISAKFVVSLSQGIHNVLLRSPTNLAANLHQ